MISFLELFLVHSLPIGTASVFSMTSSGNHTTVFLSHREIALLRYETLVIHKVMNCISSRINPCMLWTWLPLAWGGGVEPELMGLVENGPDSGWVLGSWS